LGNSFFHALAPQADWYMFDHTALRIVAEIGAELGDDRGASSETRRGTPAALTR
jgi:hypothetical protein